MQEDLPAMNAEQVGSVSGAQEDCDRIDEGSWKKIKTKRRRGRAEDRQVCCLRGMCVTLFVKEEYQRKHKRIGGYERLSLSEEESKVCFRRQQRNLTLNHP